MLMTMALVLAGVSTFMEIGLVMTMPFLKRWYNNGLFGGKIPGFWMNTGVSLLLSMGLGAMFSADGLVIAMASAISTVASGVLFFFIFWLEDLGITLPKIMEWKNSFTTWCNRYVSAFVATISFFVKVVTAPVRAIRATINFINKVQTILNNRKLT